MRIRKFLACIMVAGLVGGVVGCAPAAPTPEATPTPEVVKLTVVRDWPVFWALQAYYDVAQEKGFYADEGLEVELVFPPSPPDVVKLVGTGKAQFGAGNTVDAISARIEDLPLLIVGVGWPRDMGGMGVFEDSGIASPADLRGKTVAVYMWPQTELHFKAMMEHYGMTVEDVTKVDAGDYSVGIMVAGKADAADMAVGGEDLDIERATGREVEVFLYVDHGVPPFYTNLIFTNEEWARKNPEVVTNFLRATLKGLEYTLEHPGEVVDIGKAHHPDVDEDWLMGGLLAVRPFAEPYPEDEGQPRGWVSQDIVVAYEDFLFDGGLISEKPDPSAFIDLSFLPTE